MKESSTYIVSPAPIALEKIYQGSLQRVKELEKEYNELLYSLSSGVFIRPIQNINNKKEK